VHHVIDPAAARCGPRRAALLAAQLEGAGVVGPVGEDPPPQACTDDGKLLASERPMPSTAICPRAAPPAMQGEARRIDSVGGGASPAAPASTACGSDDQSRHDGCRKVTRGAGIGNAAGETGGRTIAEKLRRGGCGDWQRRGPAKRAPAKSGPRPESNDAVSPCFRVCFEQNAANSSPVPSRDVCQPPTNDGRLNRHRPRHQRLAPLQSQSHSFCRHKLVLLLDMRMLDSGAFTVRSMGLFTRL